MTSFFERVLNMDDKFIYILVFVITLIPLLRPIGLPISISQMVRDAYNKVDSLPEGSPVLFVTGVSPTSDAEMWPQMVATQRHAMKKKLRIIWFSLIPEAPPYTIRAVNEWSSKYGYKYGKDIVILPFIAGNETTIMQIGQNMRKLFTTDIYGSPLWEMEVMHGIEDVKDIKLIIDFTGGEGGRWIVRHIQATKGVPVIECCTAVVATYLVPFYSSGQMAGILVGLGGAAEYESFARTPGQATAGMDAQSMAHSLIIILVLLANIGLRLQKRSQGGTK